MQPSLQASFEYVYENKVWAGGGGSGEGSEPNATIFTQRIIEQASVLAVPSPHSGDLLYECSRSSCATKCYTSLHWLQVIGQYGLKSLLDAPCGALAWQPPLLQTLGQQQPGFRRALTRLTALKRRLLEVAVHRAPRT